jgi:hypothetical protein
MQAKNTQRIFLKRTGQECHTYGGGQFIKVEHSLGKHGYSWEHLTDSNCRVEYRKTKIEAKIARNVTHML